MTGPGFALKAPRQGAFILSAAVRREPPPRTCGLRGHILAPASAGGRCHRIRHRGPQYCSSHISPTAHLYVGHLGGGASLFLSVEVLNEQSR